MDDALRAGFSTLLSSRLVAFTGKHGIQVLLIKFASLQKHKNSLPCTSFLFSSSHITDELLQNEALIHRVQTSLLLYRICIQNTYRTSCALFSSGDLTHQHDDHATRSQIPRQPALERRCRDGELLRGV